MQWTTLSFPIAGTALRSAVTPPRTLIYRGRQVVCKLCGDSSAQEDWSRTFKLILTTEFA